LLHRDIDETQRAIATWPEFDKAIEALSTHINPMNSREANKKKALTIKDLLIKVSYSTSTESRKTELTNGIASSTPSSL